MLLIRIAGGRDLVVVGQMEDWGIAELFTLLLVSSVSVGFPIAAFEPP